MKSESLLVSRRVNTHGNDNILTFQNHNINQVENHTHLGITWSSNGSWKNHLTSIISKVSKRIDMLRALKFKLQREDLEIIYFAFIRPLFEYASIVWDKMPRHDKYFNEMEKLQLQCARIVTGTNNYASKQLLYNDTGWDTLSCRRENQRLILMYKIVHNLAPTHLNRTLDTYTNEQNRYQFRNINIHPPLTRTETFHNSFFPCAIRLWNSLEPSVRNAETVSAFKCKLNKNKRVRNPYYSFGLRKINTILASFRMGCSQLNSDLSKNNITNNKLCTCGDEETAFHFFFACPKYTVLRNTFLSDTVFVERLTVNVILSGDFDMSIQHNIDLHNAVSNFIKKTDRFR